MTVRLAEVTRGGAVESTHDGTVVVAHVSGEILSWAGNPETFAFFRSSAKPFQAIPLIESGAADRFDFTPAEIALCCASHSAEPFHQEQVLAMLGKLGLDEGALQCGIPLPIDGGESARIVAGQKAPSPLQCDCSGKHTGMLATSLHLGYPIDSYLEPGHPLQLTIRSLIGQVCRVDPETIWMATDGCSLPTFGLSMAAMARSFATLASPGHAPRSSGGDHAAALDRLRSAMTAHPENVGGHTDRLDTDLMKLSAGRMVAKSGAEGLLCVGVPAQGIGIAIRIADGSFRAHNVVIARVLRAMQLIEPAVIDALADRWDSRIFNHQKRHVGDIRSVFSLSTN